MSSPITPIVALSGPTTSATTPARPESNAPLSDFFTGEEAFTIEASRSGPPAEALEEIAAAGERHSELLEDGRELRFFEADNGSLPKVELHDMRDATSRRISIGEALEILDGDAPE